MYISKLLLTAVTVAKLVFGGRIAEWQDSELKIMPLGDSITEITCWRALVWDMLAEANYADQVEYVGSQNSNPQNCKPNTANWDQHPEGHSGWLAIDIANKYREGWLQRTPADIIMFMLGTNDVFQGHSTDDIIAAYTKMVIIMRASNPKTKIIVNLVIPLGVGSTAAIATLNGRIPTWAEGQRGRCDNLLDLQDRVPDNVVSNVELIELVYFNVSQSRSVPSAVGVGLTRLEQACIAASL